MVTVALNQNEMFIMEVLQKGRGGCPGRKVKVCGCLGGRGVLGVYRGIRTAVEGWPCHQCGDIPRCCARLSVQVR